MIKKKNINKSKILWSSLTVLFTLGAIQNEFAFLSIVFNIRNAIIVNLILEFGRLITLYRAVKLKQKSSWAIYASIAMLFFIISMLSFNHDMVKKNEEKINKAYLKLNDLKNTRIKQLEKEMEVPLKHIEQNASLFAKTGEGYYEKMTKVREEQIVKIKNEIEALLKTTPLDSIHGEINRLSIVVGNINLAPGIDTVEIVFENIGVDKDDFKFFVDIAVALLIEILILLCAFSSMRIEKKKEMKSKIIESVIKTLESNLCGFTTTRENIRKWRFQLYGKWINNIICDRKVTFNSNVLKHHHEDLKTFRKYVTSKDIAFAFAEAIQEKGFLFDLESEQMKESKQ